MKDSGFKVSKASVLNLILVAIMFGFIFSLMSLLAAYISYTVPIFNWAVVIFHGLFVVLMSMYAMDSSFLKSSKVLKLDFMKGLISVVGISALYVILFLNLKSYSWAILVLWIMISFSFCIPVLLLSGSSHVFLKKTIRAFWMEKWKTILMQLVPVLMFLIFIRFPEERCENECWGFFDGGLISLPWLGIYLFLASFFAAVIPSRLYINWMIDSVEIE